MFAMEGRSSTITTRVPPSRSIRTSSKKPVANSLLIAAAVSSGVTSSPTTIGNSLKTVPVETRRSPSTRMSSRTNDWASATTGTTASRHAAARRLIVPSLVN